MSSLTVANLPRRHSGARLECVLVTRQGEADTGNEVTEGHHEAPQEFFRRCVSHYTIIRDEVRSEAHPKSGSA
jgi:hypothetical protein